MAIVALLYWLWGHRLLEAMYRGTAPTLLSDLVRARGKLPLVYYVRRADALFWGVWTLALTATGLGLLSLRWRWLTFGPLSRAETAAVVGAVVFCCAPWPVAKVMAASVTTAYLVRRPLVLDRYQAGVALFTVFALAFVVAPYWGVFGSSWARGAALVSLVALGGAWARLTASPMRVWDGQARTMALLAIALALWLVNGRALHMDLPLKTDETYHVASVLILGWQPAWWLAVVLAAIVVRDARRDPRGMVIRFVLLALVCAAMGYAYRKLMTAPELLRYPLVNRWLELAPVQALLPFGTLGWQEALFRLPSFLSVVGLAWIVYAYRREGDPVGRALVAVAIATTPVLLYYTSILYLEPPAVLLMTLCCLDSERLLRADRSLLWSEASGLALLLIGFVKETTVPFLVAFCVCRLAGRLWRGVTIRRLWDEGLVVVAVLGPVGSYLLLRVGLGGATRGYGGHVESVVNAGLYLALLRSWVEQFGGLGALAVAGAGILACRRQWRTLWFFGLALGMTAAFLVMDSTQYVGYSRFNLLFAPVLVALSMSVADTVAGRSRIALAILAIGWLAGNLVLSPLRFDGSKDASWQGAHKDEYYPYRQTLTWLARERSGDRILFAGLPGEYPLQFYFVKLGWYPPIEMLTWRTGEGRREHLLAQVLERAHRDRYGVVVYHVLRDEPVVTSVPDHAFLLARVFENQIHRLAVYTE